MSTPPPRDKEQEFERHVMTCLRVASDGRKKDVALLPIYRDLMVFITAHTALAELEARIEEVETTKRNIGNTPNDDDISRYDGELLGKWRERKFRLAKLDERIADLQSQATLLREATLTQKEKK